MTMKSPKSDLDAFRDEQRYDRTDRISKALTEEASAERRDKSRTLREARIQRQAQDAGVEPSDKRDQQADKDDAT